MKKIALLIAISFVATATYTQPAMHINKNRDTEHSRFVQMLLANNPRLVQKSTQTLERVIGESDYNAAYNTAYYTLIDSTAFIYKGNNHNGSKYDYSIFEYPKNLIFKNGGTYLGNDIGIENVNGYHTIPWVLADTINTYTNYSGPEQQYMTYDRNNNLVQYSDSNTNQNFKYQLNYKSNDDFSSVVSGTYTRYYQYNSSQLIADSTINNANNSLNTVSRNIYSYDIAGNLLSLVNYRTNRSILAPYTKYENIYSGTNQLLMSTEYRYSNISNQWVLNSYDSFGYANNSSTYMYWKTTGTYQSDFRYYFSPAGIVDSVYVIDDTNKVYCKYLYSYDVFNNPVGYKYYTYHADTCSATPDWLGFYYYETYTPATSVNNISNPSTSIILYPNPATNTLQISGLQSIKGAITISLTNSIGQLMMRQTGISAGVQSISLANMAAGVYVITVSDNSGNTLYSGKMVKK